MKAYKFEVVVVDFANMSQDEIVDELRTSSRYIYPKVFARGEADIGEWHDQHPLNMRSTPEEEILKYFKDE